MVPPKGIDVTVATTAVRGQRPFRRSSGTSDGPEHSWCARGALSRGGPRVSAGAYSFRRNHIPGSCFCSGSGIAAAPGWDGIRGFGRPISLRVIHSERFTGGVSDWSIPSSRLRSCGVEAEAGAGYAVANPGLSTPVLNSLPETHMRCMITASLRATTTRARLAPRRRATATPQARSLDG
jgi:hypothetical protein